MTLRLLTLVLVAFLSVACGDDGPGSSPSPTIVQVGGVWAYRVTTTGVSGGECVGALLQANVGGTSSGTMQITQSGASLTARSTADSDGSFCDYTGTAGANSLALNITFCSAGTALQIRCSNGALRDARIQSGGINVTVNSSSAAGTMSELWNVFSSGTQTGVGVLTINNTFNATRR